MSWMCYIYDDATSNKYWKYKVEGSTLIKEWGRLGGHKSGQQKKYSSPSQAESAGEKEAKSKIRKGYRKCDESELGHKSEVAETIGFQWKISHIEFLSGDMSQEGNRVTANIGESYNKDSGVYVVMANSWTKEDVALILTKSNAYESNDFYLNGGVAMLKYPRRAKHSFVNGIKKALKQLAEAVASVVSFADVGQRKFDLPGNNEIEQSNAIAQVAVESGASVQAAVKFADLGNRTLDL